MIYKQTKKNKFGGDTWHVKLDSLFHIFISSTNSDSFLVEIKEFRWINYKTRKSYISDGDLEQTIVDSFQELQDYLNGTGQYHWSDIQKRNKLAQVLPIIQDYQLAQNKTVRKKMDDITDSESAKEEKKYAAKRVSTVAAFDIEPDFPDAGTEETQIDREGRKRKLESSKLIQIIRGVSIDENIVNLTTSQMIVEKYGEPDEKFNHNNFSYELKYRSLGLSFFFKQKDPIQLIYLMMANGHMKCETETGLIFDRRLSMEKVISEYGLGDVRALEESDEASMQLPGIMFYAKKDDLKHLEDNEIYVQRIAILEF